MTYIPLCLYAVLQLSYEDDFLPDCAFQRKIQLFISFLEGCCTYFKNDNCLPTPLAWVSFSLTIDKYLFLLLEAFG